MKPLHSLVGITTHAFGKVYNRHCCAIKLGKIFDTYTTNNIISLYTKCKELYSAHNLFDEMQKRDSVTWNTMIVGYVNCGNLDVAWKYLKEMKRCGIGFDEYTFGSILKGISFFNQIDAGQQVHLFIIKTGYEQNVYCGSALLDMYAKCKRIENAFDVFECMPERNSVSWNALIAGYARLRDKNTAFWLLDHMEREGLRIDDGTFSPLLTLLDNPNYKNLLTQVHSKIVKQGLELDTIVCNALITSYSECGSINDAKKVFNEASKVRDLVTWNSMLGAYLVHNQGVDAFKLFLEMQRFKFEPDIYTYTSVISGCFEEGYLCHGKSLHGLVIKRGLDQLVPIDNSLIAMYQKSNSKSMDEALSIFDSMESRDQVSWNSILTGFSQNFLSENALNFFKRMRRELIEIDHYAFSAVLRSCSDLAMLQLGQQIHVLTMKSGFQSNDYVASSLIFMYSKCGILIDAKRSFQEMNPNSAITWNSMIFGYAQHGEGHTALDLFNTMRSKLVKPDHITFVAILTACSHIGLMEQGCNFLETMESKYNIPPRMEHYACAIDLCGRAGRIDKAKALIESMPFDPDPMVWKTLLGACKTCGDIDLATKVASKLLELEPNEHCTYVLLSSMYGHHGKWGEVARVKRLMKERGVKKVPGWSWIEVGNKVHAFNAEDRSHVHCEEIYLMLDVLMQEMDLKPNLCS